MSAPTNSHDLADPLELVYGHATVRLRYIEPKQSEWYVTVLLAGGDNVVGEITHGAEGALPPNGSRRAVRNQQTSWTQRVPAG